MNKKFYWRTVTPISQRKFHGARFTAYSLLVALTAYETSMDGEAVNRQVLCDIARTAFEVVNRLLARDQLLARELQSETTASRQVYREECITVEMAATLRERFPQNVEITLFTPPEETRTGADWYWRFERSERESTRIGGNNRIVWTLSRWRRADGTPIARSCNPEEAHVQASGCIIGTVDRGGHGAR